MVRMWHIIVMTLILGGLIGFAIGYLVGYEKGKSQFDGYILRGECTWDDVQADEVLLNNKVPAKMLEY